MNVSILVVYLSKERLDKVAGLAPRFPENRRLIYKLLFSRFTAIFLFFNPSLEMRVKLYLADNFSTNFNAVSNKVDAFFSL